MDASQFLREKFKKNISIKNKKQIQKAKRVSTHGASRTRRQRAGKMAEPEARGLKRDLEEEGVNDSNIVSRNNDESMNSSDESADNDNDAIVVSEVESE